MKIAIVMDCMSAYGGAERCIEQLMGMYPEADLFTVLNVIPKNQHGFLRGKVPSSTFLQKLPGVARYYRKLLPLWKLAVEQLDLTDYDLILSNHHSVAYGVITSPRQIHISYVHSPMRYAWDLTHEYLRESRLDHGFLGMVARRGLHKARLWDFAAGQRPDVLVANSQFIAGRIRKHLRRPSAVVHPPVAVEHLECRENKEDFYLSVCRLVPYKRVELLVRAFATMPNRYLKIIGDGPEMRKIAGLATSNVKILGYQSNEVVRDLMGRARAFLFAGVEDFGITPLEAQACGTPVIAYGDGGVRETVLGLDSARPSGLFFHEQTPAAIVQAIYTFEQNAGRFSAAACAANAARFSEARFRQQFGNLVERVVDSRQTELACLAEDIGWVPPTLRPAAMPEILVAE